MLILMGVSGSGKTTIGELLAERVSMPFFDGDLFHPVSNIEKMRHGVPLTDADREPWLLSIAKIASQSLSQSGAIIACSALKQKYRILLRDNNRNIFFIHLKGSQKLILERMMSRKDHYMPPELLQSQFDTLEEPADALTVSIELPPGEIVDFILTNLPIDKR